MSNCFVCNSLLNRGNVIKFELHFNSFSQADIECSCGMKTKLIVKKYEDIWSVYDEQVEYLNSFYKLDKATFDVIFKKVFINHIKEFKQTLQSHLALSENKNVIEETNVILKENKLNFKVNENAELLVPIYFKNKSYEKFLEHIGIKLPILYIEN